MAQGFLKKMIKTGYIGGVLSVLVSFSGCISPKTDAFLLGAGIGAGVSAYFLNGGSIGGYSLHSLQNGSKNPRNAYNKDFSMPSELEWYYMQEDFLWDAQLQE